MSEINLNLLIGTNMRFAEASLIRLVEICMSSRAALGIESEDIVFMLEEWYVGELEGTIRNYPYIYNELQKLAMGYTYNELQKSAKGCGNAS